jgi:hypothetical protein
MLPVGYQKGIVKDISVNNNVKNSFTSKGNAFPITQLLIQQETFKFILIIPTRRRN